MIKHGKVEVGHTPSVVSGLPSEKLVKGEPVGNRERPTDPGLKKLAAALQDTPEATKEKHGAT